MMGMIQRVMTFQSSLIEMGITGWTFSTYWQTSFGPTPKLKLFWNGTLMRLPTGFCVSLANASVLASALSSALVLPPPPLPSGARLKGLRDATYEFGPSENIAWALRLITAAVASVARPDTKDLSFTLRV